MNDSDARHLRLLNLIEARRVGEFDFDDIQELKALIARNYIVLTEKPGLAPSISLNAEGQDYHQSLFELTIGHMRRARQPEPAHEPSSYWKDLRPASALQL
ncbi:MULTISPECIES: hypothetical protein [Pseudomonas]|uniref:Uncharacterized protein n=1 Tax=Pseudomonas quercus TaxID=2722792 RepID=A0ABX0YJ91_9PSED|nr:MULTISPECIES: hypothetical protein [Pseudomonas]MBF7144947.1 hypothetical protein [Pseudomonas sp. LY10J]NJP03539.1 hypothetical protein [Pseudomonas quercus]